MKNDISAAKLLQLKDANVMLYRLSIFLIKIRLSSVASKWLHH